VSGFLCGFSWSQADNTGFRRRLSLLQDVQYIAKNAFTFNEPSERICWEARALVEAFFNFVE
jgi:hypothetical protein